MAKDLYIVKVVVHQEYNVVEMTDNPDGLKEEYKEDVHVNREDVTVTVEKVQVPFTLMEMITDLKDEFGKLEQLAFPELTKAVKELTRVIYKEETDG